MLTDEEIEHLRNVSYGGLTRTVIPSDVEEKLLKYGYIKKSAGGLIPTNNAHHALIKKESEK